ncbi:MAG: hypothetical protein B6242_02780 [Anaerolineaceae bacterium 4572_78]|nr:MAG: hypothetical protein B6242_02780 [Anaerolineaceae bacterium 4572_78]
MFVQYFFMVIFVSFIFFNASLQSVFAMCEKDFAPQKKFAFPKQENPPDDDSDVVVNQVKLIDTFFKGFLMLWMCFGVMAMLAILVVFPLLQFRGSQLRKKERKKQSKPSLPYQDEEFFES